MGERSRQQQHELLKVPLSVVLRWEGLLRADGSRSAEARQKQRRRLSDAASWHDWPLDSRGAA